MGSQAYTRLIGLKVYTLGAKYLGEVRDIGLRLDEGAPLVYMVITGPGKSIGVPVSAIKAVGDIIILEEGYEEKSIEVPGPRSNPAKEPSLPRLDGSTSRGKGLGAGPKPLAERRDRHSSEEPIIPRCPRCRAALVYEPRKKRWYCPKCKEYVKLPATIESRVPRCPHCGLPLSYIEQYGKWYCYNCRRYIDIGAGV